MQDYKLHFERVAEEFDSLAEKDGIKLSHAGYRMEDLRLQTLQLIWSALRNGLFPKFRCYVESGTKQLEKLKTNPKLKGFEQIFTGFPPLISEKPDWSDPMEVWVQTVRAFIGQRFPGRIPDNPNVLRSDPKAGLYTAHRVPGLYAVETHPAGTYIDPRIAEFWREQGLPENTKRIHRDSIRVEDSYDEEDWKDRLKREAKSDAAICRVFAELVPPSPAHGDNLRSGTAPDPVIHIDVPEQPAPVGADVGMPLIGEAADCMNEREASGKAMPGVSFPNPSPPMSKKNAADAWGGEMTVKKLSNLMESGKVRHKKLNRETFIFCRDDIPNLPER